MHKIDDYKGGKDYKGEKDYKGGKVIASGGYGCIFKPGLKCIDSERHPNQISKLMTVKHATEEYNQIEKFNQVLSSVPNYENYFLLQKFTLCKPDKLTKEDLQKYNKKCKALTKKNIKVKTINSSLDSLLSLNMPYGGIDINNLLNKHFSNSTIATLNNSLLHLLINGIIPMNKLSVYHCDIKDSNILIESKNTQYIARLIDWGLSINHINKNGIPIKLYRRPFQFNVPFSSILFNKEFVSRYTIFLETNNVINYFLIREFVINYIFIWIDIRGPGHLNAIKNYFKQFTFNELSSIKKKTVRDQVIEYDFTHYYIVEYISKILLTFTNNGNFDLMLYFNTIFLPTIDIWGFVMVYISIFSKLFKTINQLNKSQHLIMDKIKYIIIHFLYESPTKLIVIPDLVNELKSLNEFTTIK
jgi:hypothetical protein